MDVTGKKLTNYPSIQYVAGFLDGEGSFLWNHGSTPTNGTPKVCISNTYLPILKTFVSMFGGTIYKMYPAYGKHRTCYRWYVTGEDCRNLVRMVMPYLVEKQEQARLLLQAAGLKPIQRGPILVELKRLKKVDHPELN